MHWSAAAAFDSSDIDGIRLQHSEAPIYGYYLRPVDDSFLGDPASGATQDVIACSAYPYFTRAEEVQHAQFQLCFR